MARGCQIFFEVLRCIFIEILKKSRAARAEVFRRTTDIVISPTADDKSEDPPK